MIPGVIPECHQNVAEIRFLPKNRPKQVRFGDIPVDFRDILVEFR